jgi:hypothetical protein
LVDRGAVDLDERPEKVGLSPEAADCVDSLCGSSLNQAKVGNVSFLLTVPAEHQYSFQDHLIEGSRVGWLCNADDARVSDSRAQENRMHGLMGAVGDSSRLHRTQCFAKLTTHR